MNYRESFKILKTFNHDKYDILYFLLNSNP